MSSKPDPSETPREPTEPRIGTDPRGAQRESLEIRVEDDRHQGRYQSVRAWMRRFGDEIFWLIVVGIGWTLIVGTLISVAIVEGIPAFVVAAALWLVVAWRVLLWRHRLAKGGAPTE